MTTNYKMRERGTFTTKPQARPHVQYSDTTFRQHIENVPFAVVVLLSGLGGRGAGLLGSLLLGLGGLWLGALVTRIIERGKEISSRLNNQCKRMNRKK